MYIHAFKCCINISLNLGDLLSAPSPRTSLEGRQPVASPPESPSWSVGGAKVGCSSDGGSTLDIISEEGFSRPRSQTAPSTFSHSTVSILVPFHSFPFH